jgi:hypothetical protein
MIVYDGIYRLPADVVQGFKPRSQWEYAWQVRIINLELSRSTIEFLKPMIVAVNQIGSRSCLTSCAESIGKRISRDFNLKIARVLWVEQFHNKPKQWQVADFKPKSNFGPDTSYHIQWRPVRPNEIELIKQFIPEVDTGI